jgi:hypothetical protein
MGLERDVLPTVVFVHAVAAQRGRHCRVTCRAKSLDNIAVAPATVPRAVNQNKSSPRLSP